jgi:hypothetical protein
MHRAEIPQAELVGAIIGIPRSGFLHDATSTTRPVTGRTYSPENIAD